MSVTARASGRHGADCAKPCGRRRCADFRARVRAGSRCRNGQWAKAARPARSARSASRGCRKRESADKPGSVEGNHSSGTRVAAHLKRPTRKPVRAARASSKPRASLFGLAPGGVCRAAECCHRRGALLPHHFTLTVASFRRRLGGLLSVALSVGSRPPGVTWHLALRSPDFPPHVTRSDCLADSRANYTSRTRARRETRVSIRRQHSRTRAVG